MSNEIKAGDEVWAWDDNKSKGVKGIFLQDNLFQDDDLYPFEVSRAGADGGDWYMNIEKYVEPETDNLTEDRVVIKAGDRCVFWDDDSDERYEADFYGDGDEVLSDDDGVIEAWNFCRRLPSNLCSEVRLGDVDAQLTSLKQYRLLLASAELSLHNPEIASLREAYTNLKKELDL